MSARTGADEPALTVRDVADRLQVSQETVRDLLRQGALVGRCGPGDWHITERDLHSFLRAAANIDACKWRGSLK